MSVVIALHEYPDQLPGWIPWEGLMLAVLAMSLITLAVPIGLSLRVAKLPSSLPWPEQARFVHVGRLATLWWMIFGPIVAWGLVALYVPPISAVPAWFIGTVLVVATIAIGAWRWAAIERKVLGVGVSRPELVGWLTMIAAPISLLVLLGLAAPARLTSRWMAPWAIAATAVVYAWNKAPQVLEKMGLARAAGPRLQAVFDGLSLGVDSPRVIEIEVAAINAFAYPWLGVVAFSKRLVDLLDDDQLRAVAMHELVHMGEPRSVSILRRAQFYSLIPLAAARPLSAGFGLTGYLAIVSTIFVTLIFWQRRAIAREKEADLAAIESSHRVSALGPALRLLHEASLLPAVLRRSSHGQLHDRLRTAGLEPDYEIPRPPPLRPYLTAAVAVLVIVVGLGLSPFAIQLLMPDSELPAQFAVGLRPYSSRAAADLAWYELDQNEPEMAAAWMSIAATQPHDGSRAADAVWLWAEVGECERARHLRDTAMGSADEEWRTDADYAIEWCESQA